MDWRRLVRHLLTGKPHLRKLFPESALKNIGDAVGRAEKGHHGEIRFAVEASLHTVALLRGLSARDRALEVFSALRVWDTEANNGVLIYLSVADRRVEIVADRGVNSAVGSEGWSSICRGMEAEFRQGRFEAGAIHGVTEVGNLLREHFPAEDADVNELPDKPVLL